MVEVYAGTNRRVAVISDPWPHPRGYRWSLVVYEVRRDAGGLYEKEYFASVWTPTYDEAVSRMGNFGLTWVACDSEREAVEKIISLDDVSWGEVGEPRPIAF